MNADWLELANPITPQVMEVLQYFCKDTTERILMNIERLDMRDTGKLASSVQGVVYNNAGGNDALVRFYYMNYGSFVEHALGRYYFVDDDLDKGEKKRGVKRRNVDVPGIGGSGFESIVPTLKGLPPRKFKGKNREEIHRAKPAINSEIRLHLRGTQERLAKTLAFTATAYVLRGMVMGMMNKSGNRFGVSKFSERVQSGQATWNKMHQNADDSYKEGFKQISEEGYAFNFVPDMRGEDAWLACRGYLRDIAYGWKIGGIVGKI